MNEMVERVTAAMRQAHLDRTFAPLAEWRLEFLARAALKAMREPTDAMIQSAATGLDSEGYGMTRGDVTSAWQAMIDAALKC